MKTDLEKLLEYCIDRQKGLDIPASYQGTKYYNTYKTKFEMLNEIINKINSLKETK